MKKNELIIKNSFFLSSICIFIVLSLFLLKYYKYQINPDGISYISIAQKYLFHNYQDAVNGYWGPLFSWLMIPYLYIGYKPLVAAKLLSITIGASTLIGIRLLINRYNISLVIQNILFFLFVPIITYFSLIVITPDILMLCLLIYYLVMILGPGYSRLKYMGSLCGIIGGLIYLTKSFGFPYIISHYLIYNIMKYSFTKELAKKRIILINLVTGFLVFLLISVCWISLISIKYDKITFGTAGSHVRSVEIGLNPKCYYCELLRPPNSTAISAFEDPTYITSEQLRIEDSLIFIRHQIKVILKNLFLTQYLFNTFSFLSTIILITALVYCFNLKRGELDDNVIYTLMTILLYTFGYMCIVVTGRYIWIDYILIILIGAKLLSILFHKVKMNHICKYMILIIFILSFFKYPVSKLHSNINVGYEHYNISRIIKKKYKINGRIASNDNWKEMIYLAFYNDLRYYGKTGDDYFNINLHDQLTKFDIDYYFVWNISDERLEYFSDYRELTNGEMKNLRIYSLK